MLSSLVKTAICLFVCFLIWAAGLAWFIRQIPAPMPVESAVTADAIVVLTGGKGRLEHGFELLAAGMGKALFISGAGKSVTRADLVLRAPPGIINYVRAMPEDRIALGSSAENTIGNAEETARWVAARRAGSILLVTSNYHMPRAIREFKELMPQLTILPAAVFPDDFSLDGWWKRDGERAMILSEYHKLLAGKLRHWFLTLTSPAANEKP